MQSFIRCTALMKSSGLSGSIVKPLMWVIELITLPTKFLSFKFLPVRPAMIMSVS